MCGQVILYMEDKLLKKGERIIKEGIQCFPNPHIIIIDEKDAWN